MVVACFLWLTLTFPSTLVCPALSFIRELTATLDRIEEILSRQRFLAGSVLTEADIRAFVTLIRYDEVYVVYFKTNTKMIREYDNIREYVKDVYQVSMSRPRGRCA